MTRPDKIPAGPSARRVALEFSLYQIDIQSYPKWHRYSVRFLMIKVNKWYGSLFELHFGERGEGLELDYLDVVFLRYLLQNIKNIALPPALLSSIAAPWQLLDSTTKWFFTNPIWKTALAWLDVHVFPGKPRTTAENRAHHIDNFHKRM
jgi:hypothetical protein